MPLSPHEQKVLASVAEELRAEDPALATALSGTTPPITAYVFPLSVLHVVQLAAALIGLAVAGTFLAGRLGVLGMTALTGVAVVPWLVGTVRSVRRRSWAMGTAGGSSRTGVLSVPLANKSAGLWLAAILILIISALVSPSARAGIALVITAVGVPWLLLRAGKWYDQRSGMME